MVKDSLLLQTIKLLGQRLAIIRPFFNETACLHPQEREIIGYCEAYIKMFEKDDPEFCAYLKETVKPALNVIGISRWPRTELTDLALKISNLDEEEYALVTQDLEAEQIRQ